MLLKIYNDSPSNRNIEIVVDIFNKGGVVIFPTDTIYGIGCGIRQIKAVNRIAMIKGLKKDHTNFSMIINNMSMLSGFTKPIPNHIFRLIRKNLPGPFTFILDASSSVPKIFQSKKKTIGIRMPNNKIISAIIDELNTPILTTSIKDDDEVVEYTTDPELIYDKYMKMVDIVIDGGYGDNEASTIVDCTSGVPEILRQGKGILEE
ncbi:MAG: threonylcarbamoyl-AMP synthase [Lentimicrobiaceae bacterium]|nr:threonylcarbamoyl-AMP synthase [Lentimicrobiaceae bacterium]MDG1900844.1 L-threonylcarbamoyladenylate synthase [Bacteroidales bacterium]|tara:strand:- start:580 stop:1194 length:615 start_codon:yes stop_codon:yes gene_type:complete